jgi:hypothetical protein
LSLQEEKEENKMAANVESMFYTRTAPWHGLGVRVEEVLGSKEALNQAGLDWKVEQTDVYAASGERIPGYKANIRDIDRSVLGIVGDRYKIVQNEEAFAFTDGLLGEGVKYETAGSLAGGKIVWMLAKLPEKYIISGDAIEPYLVFCNSHDGSGAIRVAMTPVRVVCQNTLNLAFAMAATLPADILQFYLQAFILLQKLMFLYGQWDDDFFDSVGEMTEDARNVTIVYIGYMLGVEAATKVVGNIVAKATSRGFIIKTLIKSALGREMIIKIVRAIGIKSTAKAVSAGSKAIPILGAVVSGGITLISFAPMANRLKVTLSKMI